MGIYKRLTRRQERYRAPRAKRIIMSDRIIFRTEALSSFHVLLHRSNINIENSDKFARESGGSEFSIRVEIKSEV